MGIAFVKQTTVAVAVVVVVVVVEVVVNAICNCCCRYGCFEDNSRQLRVLQLQITYLFLDYKSIISPDGRTLGNANANVLSVQSTL